MLLFIYYNHSCPGEVRERHQVFHTQLLVPGIERYRYPPIQTFRGFCLIIHYHYCRCVKSIRAGGEEEVAHSHLVIVSFDGMGEQSLTPPIGRIYYPFSKAHIVLLSLGNAPE